MRRDDLCITIPTFFRCPISMDVMKSPVILSTGVTYDRTSIQQWLDNGNNTCPATMQILPTKDFVPNHTLRRLILLWSTSSAASASAAPHLSLDRLNHIAISAANSDEKALFFSNLDGLLPSLAALLRRPSSPDLAGAAIKALFLLGRTSQNPTDIKNLLLQQNDDQNSNFFSSILALLRRGSPESKTYALRLLELIAVDRETKHSLARNNGVFHELFALINQEDPPHSSSPSTIEAALSLLVSISSEKKIKGEILKMGMVRKMTVVLCSQNSTVVTVEKALTLLEMATVGIVERGEMCREEGCVAAVMEKSMKVSTMATECAVRILWTVCCLFREGEGREKVGSNNGVTKMLLIMQSDCSPEVRRMAGDLLRVCTRMSSMNNYSSNCYQTKTAHIMPF